MASDPCPDPMCARATHPDTQQHMSFHAASRNDVEMPTPPGLERRYTVYRHRGGGALDEVLDQCFVLRPDTDVAARVALRTYAEHSDTSPELRADIHAWIDRVMAEKPLVPR